jgi:hypothetical protein
VATDDNIIYLPSSRDMSHDAPLPFMEELTEVAGVIARCLAEIDSEPRSATGFGKVTITPVLLQLAMAEQWLEKLAGITVTTWPDTNWALCFCNARIQALDCIRAATTPPRTARRCGEPRGTWEDDQAIVNAAALSRALRSVRGLVVKRYPQTRTTC